MFPCKLVFLLILVASTTSDVIDFEDLLNQATSTVNPPSTTTTTPVRCPPGYIYNIDLQQCECPAGQVIN